MKKLIALIAIATMTQAPASILMPVKIKKVETIEHELGGGAGPVIVGAATAVATHVVLTTGETQLTRKTGRNSGEHISDGMKNLNSSVNSSRTQGPRSVAGGIVKSFTSLFD
ncbi:hypothetical protein [uncultured Mediterranean phage uvMED]|nr:hypothetical protein [uncultured Mediterranean phage uvMED]